MTAKNIFQWHTFKAAISITLSLAIVVALVSGAGTQAKDAAASVKTKAAVKVKKDNVKPQVDVPELPGIKIDRKKRVVELKGKICMPKHIDWLELLVCMPKSREHESIISLVAKPSHVHGALLLIGLKPGKPFSATYDEKKEEWTHFPPKGDRVAVTVAYKNKKGKMVEVKANAWIMNQKSKKIMPDNIWLFTGSKEYKLKRNPNDPGRTIYAADIEGNIISIVNFGDEVLSRSTKARGGQGGAGGDMWGANSELIPPANTEIIIRLRPAKPLPKPKPKKK